MSSVTPTTQVAAGAKLVEGTVKWFDPSKGYGVFSPR